MTIDPNMLRAAKGGDPEAIRSAEKRRGKDGTLVDQFIEADNEWVRRQFEQESFQKQLNAKNKQIGARKKSDKSDRCEDLVPDIASLKAVIAESKAVAVSLKGERDAVLHKISNPVDLSVPQGKDEETCNAIVRTWGDDIKSERSYKCDGSPGKMHHHEILERLGGYNPTKGSKIAGHRGYFLMGPGAELNQALMAYAQKFLRKKGYTSVQTPFFMRREYMEKAAELADFAETLYRIPANNSEPLTKAKDANPDEKEGGRDDMFLIATSEQPLCCLHSDETLSEKELPIRYAGVSTCFRKEAGSHGKDCWGIFRIHQFEKVEQFILCAPEDSARLHDDMIACSEAFMKSLGLPYQVVLICTGALNDAATKKYDLEAWFPGYEAYRELVSCSNCTDYQSRDLDIKYGQPKQGEREREYVHLLNGTLCATQRTLCCILENYQTETGVIVPEVLRPFMDDQEFLPYPIKDE